VPWHHEHRAALHRLARRKRGNEIRRQPAGEYGEPGEAARIAQEQVVRHHAALREAEQHDVVAIDGILRDRFVDPLAQFARRLREFERIGRPPCRDLEPAVADHDARLRIGEAERSPVDTARARDRRAGSARGRADRAPFAPQPWSAMIVGNGPSPRGRAQCGVASCAAT